jgi:NAD(P)-dependent dehydrogenase (short-subunit alcohol dehydrogenase family)
MQDPKADVRLDGRVALVTGGTSGIGRGIAQAFLASGATVVVCGRHTPNEVAVHAARSAEFIACDVRDAAQVERLCGEIESRHGRLDVLVNNAGGAPPVDAATAAPRLTEKIIQLNLLAPLLCAQAANRLMQKQESGGSIINIASVAGGVRPAPSAAAYGAAKAGLLSATESLAMEWGPKVRVNAIIAGLVLTETSLDHYGGESGVARIAQMLPLGRMAEPADIAAACLYLASPLAAYVSGARLAVHGGGERPVFLYLAEPR